ncbi:MAG: hypothetical protein AAGD25_37220 [Cyanobacteria bacterium P01_F01_bin.150]
MAGKEKPGKKPEVQPGEVPLARGFVEVSSEAMFGEEIQIREGWLKLRRKGDGENG